MTYVLMKAPLKHVDKPIPSGGAKHLGFRTRVRKHIWTLVLSLLQSPECDSTLGCSKSANPPQ